MKKWKRLFNDFLRLLWAKERGYVIVYRKGKVLEISHTCSSQEAATLITDSITTFSAMPEYCNLSSSELQPGPPPTQTPRK